MKIANVAHTGVRSGARPLPPIPRGWVILFAALASWALFAAVGAMIVQIFSMILAHF